MDNLLKLITEELYGTIPSQIVFLLASRNQMQLKQIQVATGLNLSDIKNALILLIQQNIIYKENSEKPKKSHSTSNTATNGIKNLASSLQEKTDKKTAQISTYSIHPEEILSRVRFPRFIKLMNQKFNENGIIEEILENGCMTVAQMIEVSPVYKRKADNNHLTNLINSLIESEYLIPVDPNFELGENIEVKKEKKNLGKPRKRVKIDPEIKNEPQISSAIPSSSSNNSVHYRLNFQKLNREIISEMIGNLANFKVNIEASVIAETLYKLGPHRQFSINEIIENLPPKPKINKNNVDTLLEQLERAKLVTLSSQTTYSLDLPSIRSILQNSTIEKIIKGRFGDYHSRIFRVLIAKGLLDEKTISELTLLPPQEARICINDLFTSGFLHLVQLPTLMVYGIKPEQIKEELTNQLYISMQNLKLRLHSEMEEAWNLVQRVGSLTNEEKSQLERYKQTEARIESALLDIDRSLLIFKEI
ncbi:unnamed protein product [Blepharisma stoltei]|uniref:DNA-directed RNA polymerase III subunit RPC3 n=1 Tax=Blepharisma stoltei TaxID=1481888 RepID=A0AAU9J7N6_9CILI|nr:unnamed protein product [Blepharisma stoltei]